MSETTVQATKRPSEGGRGLAAMRAAGNVPGVLYSKGQEGQPLTVAARDLERVLAAEGRSAVITLALDGAAPTRAKVQEIQRGALSRQLVHVDFLALAD